MACNRATSSMEVLAITIFLSLLLAVFFVVFFLSLSRKGRRGLEQEALMPLDDGPTPRNKTHS
jgi:cbb3-type cytochrome oxidase subunit 3